MLFILPLLERLRLETARAGEAGQGLAEYSLLLVFIAMVAIVAVTGLGSTIASQLANVTTSL